MSLEDADTAEHRFEPAARDGLAPRPRAVIAAATHPGRVRPGNEDQYLALRLGRSLQVVATSLGPAEVPERYEEEGHVLLVADGLGGKRAGEVASALALGFTAHLLIERGRWKLRLEDGVKDIVERAIGLLNEVNRRVGERAASDPALAGMSTTLTAAAVFGGDVLIFHVGDSRAYLHRKGRLVRLTRDQTVAQALADMGAIPAAAVASHPQRHILTNVVGGSGDVEVAWSHLQVAPGDALLLCTDGLSGEVAEPALVEVLDGAEDPSRACALLVERALAAGGRDNITVTVARFLPAAG